MKLLGTSREGCWVVLWLSGLWLALMAAAIHGFELTAETAIPSALIVLCLVRLQRREPEETK